LSQVEAKVARAKADSLKFFFHCAVPAHLISLILAGLISAWPGQREVFLLVLSAAGAKAIALAPAGWI
jgi:hypothetical protein